MSAVPNITTRPYRSEEWVVCWDTADGNPNGESMTCWTRDEALRIAGLNARRVREQGLTTHLVMRTVSRWESMRLHPREIDLIREAADRHGDEILDIFSDALPRPE